LLLVYLRTVAPGLTWANAGSDGGDLIAAAATAGVPHPTGYPLYLLLARLFQLLPLGSLAFRTNLLSAVAMVVAAALICILVQNSSTTSTNKFNWLAGLVAGYVTGLAPLIWSQAIITEVYGLQTLLVAFILYLYAKPTQTSPSAQNCLDRGRGLMLGIATANHVTTLLLVLPALIAGSVHRQVKTGRGWIKNFKVDRGAFLRQLAMLGIGLSIYLLIPLRASANPPINWGDAVSLERFWWLISAQLYQGYYLQFHWTQTWARVQALAALLLQQLGLLGVLLGLIGLIVFGKFSRIFILTVWTAVIFASFAIVYESVDSYVYLIPVLLSFAIWIGLGIEGVTAQSTLYSHLLKIVVSLFLLAYFVGRPMMYANQVDASTDLRAETFGEEVFSTAPPKAILFAEGDQAVFALWYFHFALGQRPDVAVIAVDLLHFNWYQENLHSIYPTLVIPTPFPWPETISMANPSRPACYVQYDDATLINCSKEAVSP
jgi:hypothetical protein